MSTLSILADRFAWAYANAGAWTEGAACQGANTGQQPRVGVVTFSGLRASADFSQMNVTSVQLWVKYGTAGEDKTKVLSIFTAVTDDTDGKTGLDMLGLGTSAELGLCQVGTAVSARNASEVITFDSSHNAGVFPNWREWLEETTRNSLALYLNEDGSSGMSENFLSVVNAGMLIEYEPKGSWGSVSPDPVELGSKATLTIAPIAADGTLTHRVVWRLGNNSSGATTLPAGTLTASYTIPTGWISGIPANAESATAVCALTTLVNGTARATRDIPFTVKMPAKYAPKITGFSVQRCAQRVNDQGQTEWVASLSGTRVWISLELSTTRAAGVNTPTASITYYPEDDGSDAHTVSVSWSSNNASYSNSTSLISRAFDLNRNWIFVLTATNGHSTVRATARVGASWAPLHIAGTGYGVGVGMYSDGEASDRKFQCAWPAHMLGGIEGVTNYHWDEIARTGNTGFTETGGTWYSGSPIYRSMILTTLTQTLNADGTRVHTIGTLPKLPSTVISIRGTLRTTLDHNVRQLPFVSYTGDWAAAAMVEESGAVKLLLGGDYDLVMSEDAPMVVTVFVEYTASAA